MEEIRSVNQFKVAGIVDGVKRSERAAGTQTILDLNLGNKSKKVIQITTFADTSRIIKDDNLEVQGSIHVINGQIVLAGELLKLTFKKSVK